MNQNQESAPSLASLRRLTGVGVGIIGGLFAVSTVCAATIPIDSAIVAQGNVEVVEGVQDISHDTGGRVAEIAVGEGDAVEEGDVLFSLDAETLTRTLGSVRAQLDYTLIRLARLEAEAAGSPEMSLPAPLQKRAAEPSVIEALSLERKVLGAQVSATEASHTQVDLQIEQLEAQKGALEAGIRRIDDQVNAIDAQLAQLRASTPSSSTDAQIQALETERAGVLGDREDAGAQLVSNGLSIDQQKVQSEQIDKQHKSDVLATIEEEQLQKDELTRQALQIEAQIDDLTVRSPVDGIVHQSELDTIGGIVPAGQTVMSVVPVAGGLEIQALLQVTDIDRAPKGGTVRVALSSFDPNVVPQLEGKILTTSPTAIVDEASGAQFYEATVRIDGDQLDRLPANAALVPGMPAEVYVETGRRSILAYLVQPLFDRFKNALREP